MDTEASPRMVEGFGNEVVCTMISLVIFLGPLFWLIWKNRHRAFEAVHPAYSTLANEVRSRIFPSSNETTVSNGASPTSPETQPTPATTRIYNTDDCPICLTSLRFCVQANCGHMFCGECITTYWQYGTWLGAINCPVCRAVITLLMPSFREADPEEPGREAVTQQVNDYNRRFSGQPRPIMDYLRDIPVLLPHLFAQFFSMNGLILMFRLRVMMCVVIAAVYILSPLDILPEAVFGIIGVLDDLFVVFLFAIYIALAYRRFIGNET